MVIYGIYRHPRPGIESKVASIFSSPFSATRLHEFQQNFYSYSEYVIITLLYQDAWAFPLMWSSVCMNRKSTSLIIHEVYNVSL